MAVYEWLGNAVSDGTAVTGTTGLNVNTTGNGDAMTRAQSGTFTQIFAEDGFTVTGETASIVKQYFPLTATRDLAQQLTVVPGSGSQGAIMYAAFDGTDRCRVHMDMTNGFSLFDYTNTEIVASRSPALVAGHRYVVDWVVCKSASPTTANGRMFLRVTDLDGPTWSGDGTFFYDTGYVINVGTTDWLRAGFGKVTSSSVWTNTVGFRKLRASEIAVTTTHTSEAQASAYFLSAPYSTALDTPVLTISAFSNPTTPGGTNGSITVTWPAVAGAVRYEADIADGTVTSGFAAEDSNAVSPKTFTGLDAGPYTVAVRAMAS